MCMRMLSHTCPCLGIYGKVFMCAHANVCVHVCIGMCRLEFTGRQPFTGKSAFPSRLLFIHTEVWSEVRAM